MITNKKQTANMNTVLAINFMDIKVPKIKYLVFIDGILYRIKNIDIANKSVTLTSVFDNNDEQFKLSDIKDKFIKFVSIHSKITHSIQHTCIGTIVRIIKDYSVTSDNFPDDVVSHIINNKLQIPLVGKVVPCYIFPKDGDRINFISPKVIENFKLNTTALKLGTIVEIYRNHKNTIYTVKTDIVDIMCDRSDFKLVGKKDRKNLFYVL